MISTFPFSLAGSIPWDGNTFVAVVSFCGFLASVLYILWTRQQRLWRDVYGDDDDATHDGILQDREESHDELVARLDALEHHVDRQFNDLEQRLTMRHDELSLTLAKIIQHMDNPPEGVDPFAPFRNVEQYDADSDGQFDDQTWHDGDES